MIESKNRAEQVAVIGLGYVGLPLAVLSARKGYKTFGIDDNAEKVSQVAKGVNYLQDDFLKEYFVQGMVEASNDPTILRQAGIILVCVPTPVDDQHTPDLNPIKNAARSIAQNIARNKPLVVIESTINPGVCEEVVEPIFRENGKKINIDYHLAHCPERINPGDKKWNVSNIPRVVGASDKAGLKRAANFYESILDAPVKPMKSLRAAEATKIVENSFRDINIAFVNELARSFDAMGIDAVDVIEGAATKPFSFMPHWPSCGVGGHCIPVDPYYLIERAKLSGFDHKFLKLAREINNSMPEYTVELLQDILNDLKMPLNGTRVGVLGIAYKANVNDVRESPAIDIINLLAKHGAKVLTYDPFIPSRSTEKTLDSILRKADALVVVTNHSEFVETNMKLFKKHGIKAIVDGKNCLKGEGIKRMGIRYKGIGR